MTIKASKSYDQHAHETPTQASQWAEENREFEGGGGMGADTRKLMSAAASGEAPWHHSYNATGLVHGGGALRPERLTGEQMDEISPGWTDRAYTRAQRSDGGNG